MVVRGYKSSEDFRYAYEGALEDINALCDYCVLVARDGIPVADVLEYIKQFQQRSETN